MKQKSRAAASLLLGVCLALSIGAIAQDWYTATGKPVQRSLLSSADLRTEFASIQSDIADKLPALTGNGGKLIAVNSGGTALEVLDAGLGTDQLADLAVTTAKLAADSVTATKIADGAVGTSQLAVSAVSSSKIVDGGVGNQDLRNSSALSVIGNNNNISAAPADIAASANDQVLRRTSDALSFGEVPDGALSDRVLVGGWARIAGGGTLTTSGGAITASTGTGSGGVYDVTLSGFTSATSYACTASVDQAPNLTKAYIVTVEHVSATQVTLSVSDETGSNNNTVDVSLICSGQ